MSTDNSFLEESLAGKIKYPILRVYGWDKPTLSLGVNQHICSSYLGGDSYPTVKRITGGQAVLHGMKNDELTYSIVIKLESGFCNVKKIYSKLCAPFVLFLEKFGLKAAFGYSDSSYINNFNCFNTKTPADIVVNDIKVIGSAQLKKKNCILQHGSVRLDKIRELSCANVDFENAVMLLKASFEEKFQISFINYIQTKENYEKIVSCDNELVKI